ncbi:MAG: hypothetical protein JJE45_05950 [Prolixibacteraceae bacterium]|nr:hypothetical protein [Prolixibacteraceae bacterium]
MKVTDYIINKIERLPRGYVFTYSNFITDVNKKEAVIKGLNRLAATGKIVKLSKGKFYKPEETPFGSLQPNQKQIVKDLLEKDGKLLGYITGLGIYNQMGFTTQVSNIIQIGRNQVRPGLKRGIYRIRFIKQQNIITKDNIPLLQLLDVIRFIKKISDASVDIICKRLKALITKLNTSNQQTLVRLSMKYNPATRAVLGALFEDMQVNVGLTELQNSLNPITVYKLSIPQRVLPTALNWNIQ